MAEKKKDKGPSCSLAELSKLGPQPLKIGDHVIGYVNPREFSTGSYGLSFTGKMVLPLPDNKSANLQIACNCTVIGSKNALKQEESAA